CLARSRGKVLQGESQRILQRGSSQRWLTAEKWGRASSQKRGGQQPIRAGGRLTPRKQGANCWRPAEEPNNHWGPAILAEHLLRIPRANSVPADRGSEQRERPHMGVSRP